MSDQKHQHQHGKHKSARRQQVVLVAIMAAGVGLVAVLVSPFLLELMGGRHKGNAPKFSEDAANLTENEMTEDRPLAARHAWHSWRPIYDNFSGVKLGSTRQEVAKKYPLYVSGKPDAVPVVMECTNQSSVIKFRGSFYGNQLKEFTFVIGPFRERADDLKEQLYQGLGEGPRYLAGDAGSAIRVGLNDPDLVKLLSSFQKAQTLTWGDGSNRVDATVYSAVTASNQPVTMLAVRVSAATWLEDYQRKVQTGITVNLKHDEPPADSAGAGRDR